MLLKKILIVEDDVFISEHLKSILVDLGYVVTNIASSYDEAISSLILNPPDLAILDIKMHGTNQGFEIAYYIKENLSIPFLFLTSFSDVATVKEASLLEPAAYLLKPFNELQLFTTLEVIFGNSINKKEELLIKTKHYSLKINIEEILFISNNDKYIELHTTTEKNIKLRKSITGFLKEYNIRKFIQIHRSYVVNIDHINSVQSGFVNINDQKLPYSRKYAKNLEEFIEI